MSISIETLFTGTGRYLTAIEKRVLDETLQKLTEDDPKPDAAACDIIFGVYTTYLDLCRSQGLASRAALFSRKVLVPRVLDIERKLAAQFHKGALFYDTGMAHLLSGDEDGYEHFLALTDEEEFRKTGGAHKRGTANIRDTGLSAETIKSRMQFACDVLNGKFTSYIVNFEYVTGLPPITSSKFDSWRLTLDALHQFELLRVIHDIECFLGGMYPDYPPVRDNPFIMLRLAKALSHLAQWVESCLTCWLGAARAGETLSAKLKNLDDLVGKKLSNAAGSKRKFAGHSGIAVDAELRQLLADLVAVPWGPERQWRLLRILYIVRNSTAHTIEPNLAMYNDRALLLNLLQATFVSVFTIAQLKGKPIP